MTNLKLAVQDFLLPGRDLEEQFTNARAYGYDAVEIAIRPDSDLDTVTREAGAASTATGVPVAALCTAGVHDPLQEDAALRAERFTGLADLLALADALGAKGVVSVPIRPSRGFASKAALDDWVTGLTDQAVEEFVSVRRRLCRMGNRPCSLSRSTGSRRPSCARSDMQRKSRGESNHPRVLALADLFHMNIEEADMAQPVLNAGPLLGHVHIADNNRLEPGAGCMDVRADLRGPPANRLRRLRQRRVLLAGRRNSLRTPYEIALPGSAAWMRDRWAEAANRRASRVDSLRHVGWHRTNHYQKVSLLMTAQLPEPKSR